MSTALLDVRDLVLHYASEGRTIRAVDGVSFTIDGPGQALGIVGESGSGKTSLTTALMRMQPENTRDFSGQVYLDGEDILSMSPERFRKEVRWRKIAMVFQGAMNVLNPVLRVGEQIAEPLFVSGEASRKEATRRAAELLDRVGLEPSLIRHYPHELSGGQKQRVVIACALIMNPRLLILDEPTSSLDVSVQAQLMNLLKDLKETSGMSMIFITHDIGLASDICDEIAVAYAGQHVELGSADRVFVKPEHPYTQLLLASLPRLDQRTEPRSIPGQPPDLGAIPTGCRFHPRCPVAFAPCATEMPLPFAVDDDGHALCWLLAQGNEQRARDARAKLGAIPAEETDLATTDRANEPLVAAKNVSVDYRVRTGLLRSGTVHAVDRVSLAIGRGEVVALVGESGSGKSTLGRATLRLVDIAHGEVCFAEKDITRAKESDLKWLRKQGQIIFQDPFSSLNPYARIDQIIAEPLVIDGVHSASERQQRVLKALEAVQLTPAARFAARYPTQLSGGQRQRIGIARAIIRDPEYLVADEPVSMIDASSRIEVMAVLRKLQQERSMAMLYITHDIASARSFSDRIAVMNAGHIVELGLPEAILHRPVHPYTRALINAVPEPNPENRHRRRPVDTIDPAFGSGLPLGTALHPDCPHRGDPTALPDLLPLPTNPHHFVACHLYNPAARTGQKEPAAASHV